MSLNPQYLVLAGVAVTSHDASQLNTAHVEGLSLVGAVMMSTDIGRTGLPGNATFDSKCCDPTLTVEGGGADVWGPADSFQFVHFQPATI